MKAFPLALAALAVLPQAALAGRPAASSYNFPSASVSQCHSLKDFVVPAGSGAGKKRLAVRNGTVFEVFWNPIRRHCFFNSKARLGQWQRGVVGSSYRYVFAPGGGQLIQEFRVLGGPIRRTYYRTALSHGLSLVLNPMTLAQLKAVAYGCDVQEDLAVDASEWPIWLTRGYPPLPPQVADNLEQASDQAIGHAIPKFRNIVENLTAAETPEATSDVLADYLTWQELIHTTYFEDERFVQLLAYAICQCEGFRPTAAFEGAPAYAESARAFAAIVNAAYVEK